MKDGAILIPPVLGYMKKEQVNMSLIAFEGCA